MVGSFFGCGFVVRIVLGCGFVWLMFLLVVVGVVGVFWCFILFCVLLG